MSRSRVGADVTHKSPAIRAIDFRLAEGGHSKYSATVMVKVVDEDKV